MKRNKFLTFSLYFFRFVQLCLILMLVAGIILLVAYQLKPEEFKDVRFTPIEMDIEWVNIKEKGFPDNTDKGTIALGDVHPVMLYLIYLQIASVFTLFWLAIREFKKVIRSLQQLQTFQNCNVEAFRKMATYFLVIFILSNLHFFVIGNKGRFTIDLDLTFAMLAVASYIIAEIFKEGNRLQEEHQLTV